MAKKPVFEKITKALKTPAAGDIVRKLGKVALGAIPGAMALDPFLFNGTLKKKPEETKEEHKERVENAISTGATAAAAAADASGKNPEMTKKMYNFYAKWSIAPIWKKGIYVLIPVGVIVGAIVLIVKMFKKGGNKSSNKNKYKY